MAGRKKPGIDSEEEASFLKRIGSAVLLRCLADGLTAKEIKVRQKRMRRALGLKT